MASKRDLIVWENVTEIIKEKKMSLSDLARAIGVRPQSINSIKSGARGIGPKTLNKLARALNVDELELMKVDIPPRPGPDSQKIPVISWVQAGSFKELSDIWPAGVSGEGEPVQSAKKVSSGAFALRVDGDSMAPRYLPGDVIVVDPAAACDNGSPCVCVLNGEAVFKLFRETEEAIILEPLNGKYPEIVIRKERSVDFRVVGKVVDLIANI